METKVAEQVGPTLPAQAGDAGRGVRCEGSGTRRASPGRSLSTAVTAEAETNPANYNRSTQSGGSFGTSLHKRPHSFGRTRRGRRSSYSAAPNTEIFKGRADYDVRAARLDAQIFGSAVKVAAENRTLAERALTQSRTVSAGVTNYLEGPRGGGGRGRCQRELHCELCSQT